MILFLIFVIVPLIEVGLFITIGGQIGVPSTLFLCVATAIAGAVMIRQQGLHTLMTARGAMERNEFPAKELFDGLCLALAGALMLTPGFFTDMVGFLLLVPPVRAMLRVYLSRHAHIISKSHYNDNKRSYGRGPGAQRGEDVHIIEADYERIDEPEENDRKT